MMQNAFAILPDTMLQNEKQSGQCDITEIESGLFRPARITIEYHPEIKILTEAIGRSDEFSSKVDSTRVEGIINPDGSIVPTLYNLATNMTEHFVFRWEFQTGATPENPKTISFRYISQDNIQVAIDSPKIITETYCKVVSVRILQPPFIQTEEELYSGLANYHGQRFDRIEGTDRQQTDLLTINVFSQVIGFAIFGVGIFLIFLFYRTNMAKFDNATKNLRIAVGLQRNQITATEYSLANMKNMIELIRLDINGKIQSAMDDFMVFLASETKKEIIRKSETVEQKQEGKDGMIPPVLMDVGRKIVGQFVELDEKKPKSNDEELRDQYMKRTEDENKTEYNMMFEVYKKSVEEGSEDKELYKKMKVLDEVIHKQIMKREVDTDE